MKKPLLIVVFLSLFGVTVALASYPVNENVLLVNSIQASTTTSLVHGMQVATIVFQGPQGKFGQIVLSPVQPFASNIEYKVGNQILQISAIRFQAAFGLVSGQVICTGSATDANGNNVVPFQKKIAIWSN